MKTPQIYLLTCKPKRCPAYKDSFRARYVPFIEHAKAAKIPMKKIKIVPIWWKDLFTKQQLLDKKYLSPNHINVLRKGEMGNYMSHMKALKAFIRSKEPYCVVLEDDALIKPNFWTDTKDILKVLQKSQPNWDIVWLYNSGYCEYKKRNSFPQWRNAKLGGTFKNCDATAMLKRKFGVGGFEARFPLRISTKLKIYRMKNPAIFDTLAYLISRKGAINVLNRAFPITSKPTDVFMQDFPQSEVHFSVKPAKMMQNPDGTVWFDSQLMEADKIADSTLMT